MRWFCFINNGLNVQYLSSLPYRQIKCEKKLVLSYELFFKYGGEGGLTRFARPAGSPLTVFVVCPTGCASCRTPVGASHPPWSAICEKKSSHFRTSFSLNMAVRGGFEPPIRCRIHTFQACSFSHSDTSPNCFAARPHRWQRGATIGSWSETVKKNLYRLICLVTQ